MAENSTPLLPPKEVADRLSLSLPTVYRRIHEGTLPAVRLGERGPLRVTEQALRAFLRPVTPRAGGRGSS